MDDQFKRNWPSIQEAGLYRGAYHYAQPGTDAETQAVHFASLVGPLSFRDLPPALDLEQSDGRSAADVLSWARRFIDKAEAIFGRKMMVYTGHFWRSALEDPAADGFFDQRSLWLAGYVLQQKLQVPNTWNSKSWTFWQFSNGTLNGPQKIPGVSPCDQSWFNGDDNALKQLCQGGAAPTPPPAEGGQNGAWPGTYFIWPRTPAIAGTAVTAWQQRLNALGFPIDADGTYGPQSKKACLAFQRNAGLVPDGVVGAKTWNATFAPTESIV